MQANPRKNSVLELPASCCHGQTVSSVVFCEPPGNLQIRHRADGVEGQARPHTEAEGSTGDADGTGCGEGTLLKRDAKIAGHQPVLVFQGGGYEGCFFEWNAILFKPGTPCRPEPVQPCVTGRAGKRVLEAAQKGLRAAVVAAINEGDWHLCTTEVSWEKFDDDFNKGFVRAVCKAAGRECRCERCRQWFDPDEIVHLGYRGNGGIGVQFDDNHCQECAEQEHDDYCAKYLWKYESTGARVEAIQRHNEESVHQVSVFAARREEAPVSYRFYSGEPEFY